MNKELRGGLLDMLGATIMWLELEGTPAAEGHAESREETRKELIKGLKEAMECVQLDRVIGKVLGGIH